MMASWQQQPRLKSPTTVLVAADKPSWYVVTVLPSDGVAQRHSTYEAARRNCSFTE